ncbi:hypothetical protein EIP91_003504 [Steccherinum ochraceum]|uniref:RING-type domain-containing protein n=1 Tax=Steccherinum ochraceum TaxID=92696 RepID=A0A4R0RSX6_9APHY|nr:hypothetical protein EIP91_003504 [Steccherinum ochraceum]
MDDGNEEVYDDVWDGYYIDDLDPAQRSVSAESIVAVQREAQRLIAQAILRLPTLRKDQVPLNDNCGICLQGFEAIQEGETQNEGSLQLEDGQEVLLSGVTKLEACGHMFCRLDLIEWIKGYHGTCPACRHQFLEITSPPSREGTESVDEDYIPEDEDELLESDGFTDGDDWELESDEMDLDVDVEDLNGSEGAEVELPMRERFTFTTGEEESESPGLSDSFGSDSLSEGEVLASLSADERFSLVSDSAVHIAEDESGADDNSQASEEPK